MVKSFMKLATTLILTSQNPTNPSDPHQHWIKEDEFGKYVKDAEGFTSFALINKATGQALQHTTLMMVDYNFNKQDKSILFIMGNRDGDGYRTLRKVDKIQHGATQYSILDTSLTSFQIYDH
ncbi:ricin B-like lectin R40G3 [Rutidosis leptorrhynchoides]|uniref:ricin B-like lectin R40G3 n=1 Tax=Rutidosis leptorrhynchoides TaxID=125765 RepID=UPI003A9A0206